MIEQAYFRTLWQVLKTKKADVCLIKIYVKFLKATGGICVYEL